MKKRRKIPDNTLAKLLFNSDHACNICHEKGKDVQTNHIDGNPANYEYDNLIVLCADCHSKVTRTGGLGRKYTRKELKLYKQNWESTVAKRRQKEAMLIADIKESKISPSAKGAPVLEINFDPENNPDFYRRIISLVDSRQRLVRTQIEIRVSVTNMGDRTAESCMGEIQIINRPNGCTGFSGESKTLQWTQSVSPIKIHPKQTVPLDVVFAVQNFSVPFAGSCAHQGKPPMIRAWSATMEAIQAPNIRLQDGFCEGEFKVRLSVYSKNAEPVTKEYVIEVGRDWQQLNMRPV